MTDISAQLRDRGNRLPFLTLDNQAADHIDALEASNKALVEALRLADAELAAANMNIAVVERKARAAIAEVEGLK